jgi:hypothetical protein
LATLRVAPLELTLLGIKIMKKSFVSLLLIASALSLSQKIFAQMPQIDSIQVEMTDLRFQIAGSTIGGTAWDSITLYSKAYMLGVKNQTFSSDTIKLITTTDRDTVLDTVNIVFDSILNRITYIKYYYYYHYESYFHTIFWVLKNADFENIAGNIRVNVSSGALNSAHFYYQDEADDDYGYYNLSKYVGSVPTSNVAIIFYVHNAIQNVRNSNAEKSFITIFPNPASQFIVASFDESTYPKQVSIFNVLGNEVLKRKLDSSQQIDVSSLTPGIYYLRAGNQTQRFVVAR